MFHPSRRPKLGRAFRRWASFLSPAAGPTRASAIRPGVRPGLRTHPRPHRDTIVWYASIITLAAAADVKYKQQRRTHWDVAIAEAEAVLQITPDQAAAWKAQIFASHHYAPRQPAKDLPVPIVDEPQIQGVPSSAAAHDLLPKIPQFSQSTVIDALFQPPDTDTQPSTRRRIPRSPAPLPFSIYARHADPPSSVFQWTPKKLARAEYSVAKLSATLLNESGRDPAQKAAAKRLLAHVNPMVRNSRFADPHELNSLPPLEYPKYEQLEQGETQYHQRELCKAITSIIAKYSQGSYSLSTMLQKISHNLMVSPSPPNAIVYSSLVSRFSRLKLYDLANAVISSMRESSIRHDEISVSVLLAHYIRQHSYRPFDHLVRQIQGKEGGLMLANPELLDAATPEELRVRVSNGKLIQKMPINEWIANQIIFGYLSFRKTDSALSWLKEFNQQGFRLDTQFANTLLWYNYRCQNWEQLDDVWQQIYARIVEASPLEAVDPQQEQFAFYYVLRALLKQRKYRKFKLHFQLGRSRGWSVNSLLRPGSFRRAFGYKSDAIQRRRRELQVLQGRISITTKILWDLATQLASMTTFRVSRATLRIAHGESAQLAQPAHLDQLIDSVKTNSVQTPLVRAVSTNAARTPLLDKSTTEETHGAHSGDIAVTHSKRGKSIKQPSAAKVRFVIAYHRAGSAKARDSNANAEGPEDSANETLARNLIPERKASAEGPEVAAAEPPLQRHGRDEDLALDSPEETTQIPWSRWRQPSVIASV